MDFGKNGKSTRSLQSMRETEFTLNVRDFWPCRLVEKKNRFKPTTAYCFPPGDANIGGPRAPVSR